MGKVVVSLSEEDIEELTEIIVDRDKDLAYTFLKEKIYKQVEKREKGKLDVNGKTHL